MMKKILILMLTLIIASNFFYTKSFAASDEEKVAKNEAKVDKNRAKKISKKIREENFGKVIELAEQGDFFAEMILSYAYKTGQRVPHTNYKISEEFFKKAASKNKNLAENFIPPSLGKKKINLSKIFGIAAYHAHLQNNFEKAIFWAEMGASENEKFSLAYLGSAYYTGRGVGQDFKIAIDFLKRAGDEQIALKLLSDAYEKGNGVEKDLKKSKIYADYLALIQAKKIKPKK